MAGVSTPRLSLKGQRKLPFLGKRHVVLMLCLDSTLLMWFKVGPTKGKKAIDIGSSLGISSASGGLRLQRISLLL